MNIDIHSVWIDDQEYVATFPLWNLSNQMMGYQTYRPNASKEKHNHPKEGRYYTYRRSSDIVIWGLESWSFSNTLFVTEGIFDACRLTKRSVSAIALFSNDTDKSTARWLWMIRKSRKVVTICDNDVAGKKLMKYGHESEVVPTGDLGDSSEEYVQYLIEKHK